MRRVNFPLKVRNASMSAVKYHSKFWCLERLQKFHGNFVGAKFPGKARKFIKICLHYFDLHDTVHSQLMLSRWMLLEISQFPFVICLVVS